MNNLNEIATISEQRNQVVYGWLRWLVVVAAGSFAAMLGLMGSKTFPVLPFWLLKAALLCQAGGILFGAIALYGEVAVVRGLAESLIIRYANTLQGKCVAETNGVTVFPLPPIYLFCERMCYLCLLLSLLCLGGLVILL